jgi:rhamnogalacturonyl hydrolase YesR
MKFNTKMNGYWILILTLGFSLMQVTCDSGQKENTVIVEKKAKVLTVAISNLVDIDTIEIQLESERNKILSKNKDRSTINPAGGFTAPKASVWYLVMDSKIEKNTRATVLLNDFDPHGKYTINGAFFKDIKAQQASFNIPTENLLEWENSLTLEPEATVLQYFTSSIFSVLNEDFHQSFQLLSEDWSGTIRVFGIGINGRQKIAEYYILEDPKEAYDPDSLLKYKNQGITKDRLLTALKTTIDLTLRMQDQSENAPTLGGLNLFYDYDAKTYRRPHWIWSSGPNIKMLLDAANNVPELRRHYSPTILKESALRIGKTTQLFQQQNPTHPAYGIVTSRWKEVGHSLEAHGGFEEFYSVADALFLVGWGWIPLFRETNDSSFLHGSQLMVVGTQKLLDQYEILPMDYIESEQKWKDFTISEAGFGTEGINELYLETKNPGVKKTGQLYIDRLLSRFQQQDGLWARKFNFNPEKIIASQKHTRGQGWAMEGLISSYTMTKDQKYKRLAEKMANVLMEYQHEDGFWTYNFDKSVSEVGISEKGTALWSLLFYRLYHITQNPAYLETARKALVWCMDNQYTGPDIEGYGGIIGVTSQSGVTYRKWYPMTCSYTSGFFGLAILEELKLQNTK